nr:(deoxy)nucleoside triphosphate pyrophosphohydrolase [Novosphingobium flavum]
MLVVAAALISADGRICMQQRPLGKNHGGLWEFPGGKVEAGEGPRAALVREIEEELGARLDEAALVPVGFADSAPGAGAGLVILLYACRSWRGEVRCLEGEAIGWYAPGEVSALAMPPLDYPLAEQLEKVLGQGSI